MKKILKIILVFLVGTLILFVLINNEQKSVHIKEQIYAGPNIQSVKEWKIPAVLGKETSSQDWKLRIIKIDNKSVTVQFEGKIYKDLLRVDKPVVIIKDQKEEFDTGTVGGGAVWEIRYY